MGMTLILKKKENFIGLLIIEKHLDVGYTILLLSARQKLTRSLLMLSS